MAKLDPTQLPNRVRHWRELRGKTLRDIAPLVGLAHGSLQRIETGERELNQYWMERLGEVLGVVPADFLRQDIGGLSEDERRVVDTLRSLPDAARQMILAMIDSQQAFRTGEAPGTSAAA